MSDDLFLLNKVIGRKKYSIYVLAFLIGFIILETIGTFITFTFEKTDYNLLIAASMSFQITLMVFINTMLFILSYKRFRDINLSGLFGIFAALIFVQIPVVIFLMFVKGKERDKKSIEESMVDTLEEDATITLCEKEDIEVIQSNLGQ
ncbi:DUF805 domain-containing protein [Clostridium subterminale]|uniref:DUF805 domain-containing protein n=1 Tax=Clostridium subterminale TaxID=1550 RepID=A0ABN1KY04_CLOSU